MSEYDDTAPLLEWLRQPRWMEGAKQRRLFEAAAEIERLREHCRLQAEDIMTLGQEVGRLTQQLGSDT